MRYINKLRQRSLPYCRLYKMIIHDFCIHTGTNRLIVSPIAIFSLQKKMYDVKENARKQEKVLDEFYV